MSVSAIMRHHENCHIPVAGTRIRCRGGSQISPGILLMVMEREVGANGAEHVPLRVHHIEDGALLKACTQMWRLLCD